LRGPLHEPSRRAIEDCLVHIRTRSGLRMRVDHPPSPFRKVQIPNRKQSVRASRGSPLICSGGHVAGRVDRSPGRPSECVVGRGNWAGCVSGECPPPSAFGSGYSAFHKRRPPLIFLCVVRPKFARPKKVQDLTAPWFVKEICSRAESRGITPFGGPPGGHRQIQWPISENRRQMSGSANRQLPQRASCIPATPSRLKKACA